MLMIWEHGVLERNGHDEPWTAASVTDADGVAVPLGGPSDKMGAAVQGSPRYSIAVRAPAFLHLTLPAGTTGLRIDARADPLYAKNGSMQVAPMLHPPTGQELHFLPMRYVFGAPKSRRQKALEGIGSEMYSRLRNVSMAINYRDFASLLPPEVRQHWRITSKGLVAPKVYAVLGDQIPTVWNESDEAIRSFALPEERKVLDRLADDLRGSIELRDDLADFLAHTGGFSSPNPALALTFAVPELSPESTQRYHQLLAAAQADESRLLADARSQLTTFAELAWRMPLTPRAQASLEALYQGARDEGCCFDAAMKRALTAILLSPHLLYRAQHARMQAAPYALSGQELADRLAFTVWGSIPDRELLTAAAQGRLADQAQRRLQIMRLLGDPRAQALAEDFAGQAFLFAGFDRASGPDAKRFPEFTQSVRDAMRKECSEFFPRYILQQDRPLTEIVRALTTCSPTRSWPASMESPGSRAARSGRWPSTASSAGASSASAPS